MGRGVAAVRVPEPLSPTELVGSGVCVVPCPGVGVGVTVIVPVEVGAIVVSIVPVGVTVAVVDPAVVGEGVAVAVCDSGVNVGTGVIVEITWLVGVDEGVGVIPLG